jgi:chromosome segregation ATPase
MSEYCECHWQRGMGLAPSICIACGGIIVVRSTKDTRILTLESQVKDERDHVHRLDEMYTSSLEQKAALESQVKELREALGELRSVGYAQRCETCKHMALMASNSLEALEPK